MKYCYTRTCALAVLSATAGLVALPVFAAAPSVKPTSKSQAQISLVEAGVATATIYLAQNPTAASAFAAAELREHIRRITGASIPVVYDGDLDSSRPSKGTRILIGESVATRRLGIKPQAFKTQEHLIRFLPDTVILMGKEEQPVVSEEQQQALSIEPELVAGKFGKAGNFDGRRRQRVFDGGFSDEAGTFEGWVSIASNTGGGTIFRLDGSDPWSYHIVQQEPQSNTIAYRVYLDGKGSWSVVSAPLSPGWHFIQATHSAVDKKIELFIDGVSQGTAHFEKTTCRNQSMDIGGSPDSTGGVGNAFQGLLDDLRVSNVVRTPGVPQHPLQADDSTTYLNSFDLPRRPKLHTRLLPLPELFSEKGALGATYEFLEKFCGVNWYLPGEIGTTFRSIKKLRVGGKEIRRAPAMKYREIVPASLPLQTGGAPMDNRDVAIWKLRMRLGGERYAANHSFQGYYDRFLKDHPDWFATTNKQQNPQLSYSNPEVVRQVVQDARDYFDGKGKQPGAQAAGKYFGLVPMDTDLWSAADRLLFDPQEAANPQFSNGKASPVVWGFVNNVAREVGKTNPGGYLSALAYWEYAYPPKNLKLEPNISVQMCLHARNWWSPAMARNDRKMLNDWALQSEGKRPLFLWLYYCFPGLAGKSGKYTEFPGFFAHTVVQQMKLYKDAGIRGIFMEHSSQFDRSFLLDQLEMHVTWKLADNPDLDGKQLINSFFRNYYGSAARPMQTMYEEMEKTYSDPRNYPAVVRNSPSGSHQTEELAWKYLGTPQRMARWGALITEAKSLAKTSVERERLSLFVAGVWEPMQAAAVRYRRDAPELERIKAAPLPRVMVPAIATAAGDGSKVDWNKALNAGRWSEITGLASKIDIEMKLAHDGKFLYVQLTDPRHGNTLVSSTNIFSGDDWELFFAAQRARPYHQFAFNPAGDNAALRWTDGDDEPKWQSGANLQTVVTAQGWTAQLALPLEKLLPGGIRPGQTFFANAYRSKPNSLALAWSPNFNSSFHDLKRMVQVVLE